MDLLTFYMSEAKDSDLYINGGKHLFIKEFGRGGSGWVFIYLLSWSRTL